MGCRKEISYDRFPRQAEKEYIMGGVGKRVGVCFNFDFTKELRGTIVRSDLEEPYEMIIKLDNGNYIRAVECQYKTIADDEAMGKLREYLEQPKVEIAGRKFVDEQLLLELLNERILEERKYSESEEERNGMDICRNIIANCK